MTVAAFVVSIVSVVVAIASVWFAWRSSRSAAQSATAAATTAELDLQRRHVELAPRFRATCRPYNPGSETLLLQLSLSEPHELERLDELTVTIRDDHPWRGQAVRGGGPSAEQIAKQIWGPYRFIPGTGPEADPGRGVPGADPTGRTTPTAGMPVGETLSFCLERTSPPSWSHQTHEDWQRQCGTTVRLRLECHREGHLPWTVPFELMVEDGHAMVDVP